MTQSSTQALSQEIRQSAQRILRHLNEFDFGDDPHTNIKRESDFANLFSTLQTEESTSLLQDVNHWTENRCESYQKFDGPLLNQVEENQKLAELATSEAIPTLKNEMDEFDTKLIDAKSKLSLLTENVMHAATNAIEGSKTKELPTEIPQLQLDIPHPPVDDSNEKELSRIEYENQIIRQLKKRQEYFLDALKNFDQEFGSIQVELNNSKEETRILENENIKLKKELEMLGKRRQLLIGNEIKMELEFSNLNLEIVRSNFFEIPYDESKYMEIQDNESKYEENNNDESKNAEMQDDESKYAETLQVENTENSEKVYQEELNAKMAKCNFIFLDEESITIEPDNEYVILPRSEADEYLNYLKNNNNNSNNNDINNNKNNDIINNANYAENEDEKNNCTKFHYTNHTIKDINQPFDPFSITSEISFEMKTNEKGEIVFGLTDEEGSSSFGNFTPESAEEIQNEIHKDIEHLIAMNASSTQTDFYPLDSDRNDQIQDPTNPFDVSINKNPTFTQKILNPPMNKNSSRKMNTPYGNNPFEAPQPILPIGIRQKEGQNGKLGFRFFFKQNNDALIVDADVKQHTKDGLIIINNPSPNILIRIEDGFSHEFASRCRENPNLNFILRPFRPDGSKDRVVTLFDNRKDSYHPNFFRENGNTPCVWSSFPVRPPPPIYRSSNRPQTNQNPSQRKESTSSFDFIPNTASASPRELPYLSPHQIYQMRRSSPSNIARKHQQQKQQLKSSQMQRVRHSYNASSFTASGSASNSAIAGDVANNNVNGGESNSPRKIIQIKNGRRIVSPDNKARSLKFGDKRKIGEPNQRFASIRKLNRPNDM